MLTGLTNLALAHSDCTEAGKTLMDSTACRLSTELSRPARWIDYLVNQDSKYPSGYADSIVSVGFLNNTDGVSQPTSRLDLGYVIPSLTRKFELRLSSRDDTNETNSQGTVTRKNSVRAVLNVWDARLSAGIEFTPEINALTEIAFPLIIDKDKWHYGITPKWRYESLNGSILAIHSFIDRDITARLTTGLDHRTWLINSINEHEQLLQWHSRLRMAPWSFRHTLAIDKLDKPLLPPETNYWTAINIGRTLNRSWFSTELELRTDWKEARNYEPVSLAHLRFIANITHLNHDK